MSTEPTPPVHPTEVRLDGKASNHSTVLQVGKGSMVVNYHATSGTAGTGSEPPRVVTTFSLPRTTIEFAGREREITGITQAVTGAIQSGRTVPVHAIDGMPGVGKTALAVRVAHQLADLFPDRRIFVDLYSHTAGQQPAEPQSVLLGLLTADGVDPLGLPKALDELVGMWRTRMAGKRAVFVFDNAESYEQIEPLLPATRECLVLVTSRRRLNRLRREQGAVIVSLETLPERESVSLFSRLAGRTFVGDEAAAVLSMVRLCGHLPLAITILAARLQPESAITAGDLLAELEETQGRLSGIDAQLDEGELGVAAAFELSYRGLPPQRQQVLRQLGLAPTVDIEPYAVSALTAIGLADVRQHLKALSTNRLVNHYMYGRYHMHDLVRDYAAGLAATDEPDERDHTLERLFAFYQATAIGADRHFSRHSRPEVNRVEPPAVAPRLGTREQATAWVRAERANIIACIAHTVRHQQHLWTIGLASSIAGLLRNDGPWQQAVELHTRALTAARELGSPLAEANALNELALVRRLTGDHSVAADLAHQALVRYRNLGDRHGQANALNDLGIVRDMAGDSQGAAKALDQALLLYRSIGNRLGEANALNDIGVARRLTSDYGGAIEALERALACYEDLGNQLGEAHALHQLGIARRLTGSRAAADAFERALTIYRNLGNRLGVANALNNLAVTHRWAGNYPDAIELMEQALATHRDIGSQRGEARCLNDLGAVHRLNGDYPRAAEALEQSLRICRSTGHRRAEVTALNDLGALHVIRDDPETAQSRYEEALLLARGITSKWDEAHALAGLGRCARIRGNIPAAEALLRQALDIFESIGAAEAAELRTELSATG